VTRAARLRLGAAAALAVALVSAITVQNTLLAASPAPQRPAASFAWVPATLQGLRVQRENVTATLAQDRRALWVDQVGLYTLRRGKELQATLQVARFRAAAPWQSADFDESLAGQLGTATPVVARLDGVRVYITATRGLGLAAWFRNGWMFVLGIRATYPTPRELIRAALAVHP
jgi:hypothetical protein